MMIFRDTERRCVPRNSVCQLADEEERHNMNGPEDASGHATLLKDALLELRRLQAELDAFEQQRSEPIAIIGMGCRFPGAARDPESFWRLLNEGRDAITDLPTGRWDAALYDDPNPDVPGKMYTTRGGYIEDVDVFDAPFFGLVPREAVGMDPQQRLLLTVSWEALEHAAQAPDRLDGSRTGVFMGISTDDYAQLSLYAGDPSRIDAYTSLGNARSIAVGRLAYVLGLHGPTLQVDTSCSSALVAVHLACQSLRAGECDLALAGGVNLILTPTMSIGLCKLRALAPDGRCKTFDASANGYVRGEGCGIVVLKRLADAIANRDTILAYIRGSAVNHDGRSNGLTAPSGVAQEAVMRQAIEGARIDPVQVHYLEAHGTGTSLGDPIEVMAAAAVYGAGRRPEQPLVVGSVKPHIGHLEAAAGVAGLMKVVLALQHLEIPPPSPLHPAESAYSLVDLADYGTVRAPVVGRLDRSTTRRRQCLWDEWHQRACDCRRGAPPAAVPRCLAAFHTSIGIVCQNGNVPDTVDPALHARPGPAA